MIEQAMSLKKRYDKMVKGFKEEDFKGWFVEFFALYPFIITIRWVQYTPYFNDGEECVFSVNEPEIEVSASYLQSHPDLVAGTCDAASGDEEPSERFISSWNVVKRNKDKYPELYDAVEGIKELFNAEDILRHVFGEHAEVVVTPEKIVVEEYVHD